MSRYSKQIKELIKEEIKDEIKEYENTYGCDLANAMYNNDYYIIGTYKAKQFLKEYFDDMCECLESYQQEFGEPYGYINDPERLTSLITLFVAEEILSESKTLNRRWNERLSSNDIKRIINEL